MAGKTRRSLSISEARARLPELARYLSTTPDGVVFIEHRDRAERLALVTERHLRYLESLVASSLVREGDSFQLAGSMTSDLDDEELDKALMAVKREGESRAHLKDKDLSPVAELAVTDSHGLIWYATGRKRKLGSKARRLFERADSAGAAVYIPSIALVEIAEASNRGVVHFSSGFVGWCRSLLSSPHFIAVDLGLEIVVKAEELYAIRERGDRLIAATAAVLDLPLITRDPEIAKAAGVELLW